MSFKRCKVDLVPTNQEPKIGMIAFNKITEELLVIKNSFHFIEYDTGKYIMQHINIISDGVIVGSTDSSTTPTRPSDSFVEKYAEHFNKKREIDEVMVEYLDDWDKRTKSMMLGYGDDPNKHIFEPRPKTNDSLQMTITKVKGMWTKEEITKLFEEYRLYSWKWGSTKKSLDNWLAKNL